VRTKYIVTLTNPDDIDPENLFEGSLEFCESFTSKKNAEKEFERQVDGGTNMEVFLLEVKCLRSEQGKLGDL
jgi:hypothetical protein